jgi:hypothetical protein
LERAPRALDAGLGLRAAGADIADAEGLEDPAEGGRGLGPGQLFLTLRGFHRPADAYNVVRLKGAR